MPLGGLQHYTIEPADLERTRDFYCAVLGLENGDRPPLDFSGYWLYSGGVATVHLMGTRKPREGIVVRGTERKYTRTPAVSITLPLRRPTPRECASVCKPKTSSFARVSFRVRETRSSFFTTRMASAWN
jgi:catechol 2,3-dioxygenase-like lactoylglutathione lyase family enzyme